MDRLRARTRWPRCSLLSGAYDARSAQIAQSMCSTLISHRTTSTHSSQFSTLIRSGVMVSNSRKLFYRGLLLGPGIRQDERFEDNVLTIYSKLFLSTSL